MELIFAILVFVSVACAKIQEPSLDFKTRTLVKPELFHGTTNRQISSTREKNTTHVNTLIAKLNVDQIERILDLKLNNDLIPIGYQERHQQEGNDASVLRSSSRIELCHYQGNIRGVPTSWVALSTCKGLRGVIFDGENLYHIEPTNDSVESDHYLYRDRDFVTKKTCGFEEKTRESIGTSSGLLKKLLRYKREDNEIHGPYNSNNESRYIELAFVVDKGLYVALNENLDDVYRHCIDIANIANSLYAPLNVFVALVGVEVWSDENKISSDLDSERLLSGFLRYRREKLLPVMPNDNAQLLTRSLLTDGKLGKTLRQTMCSYEYSGGVVWDFADVASFTARNVVHQLGHNFGMEHDNEECKCSEDTCIMASSHATSPVTRWSTCSIEKLHSAFETGQDYCLRNKPRSLFGGANCGNGFVETGEECDCGTESDCDNKCCDSKTCKLLGNASCATGECCDLNTCTLKSAGVECRSAKGKCDLPNYCTGIHEYCPSNASDVLDGEPCEDDEGYCYKGFCRTRDDQCQLLWGSSGKSAIDQCYGLNRRGTRHGNCGYSRPDQSYAKCANEDVFCGMLQCTHSDDHLKFGLEALAIQSHSFININGSIKACRAAIIDLGIDQPDPGLVFDGTKCGFEKICLNQKCVSVDGIKVSVPTTLE